MSELEFEFESLEGAPNSFLLRLKGRIDSKTVPSFQEKVDEMKDKGMSNFVLDMGGVDYINSTGLGTLVKLHDRIEEEEGNMALADIKQGVRVPMESLGVDAFFDTFDTPEEAIESLIGPRSTEEPEEDIEEVDAVGTPDVTEDEPAGEPDVEPLEPEAADASPVDPGGELDEESGGPGPDQPAEAPSDPDAVDSDSPDTPDRPEPVEPVDEAEPPETPSADEPVTEKPAADEPSKEELSPVDPFDDEPVTEEPAADAGPDEPSEGDDEFETMSTDELDAAFEEADVDDEEEDTLGIDDEGPGEQTMETLEPDTPEGEAEPASGAETEPAGDLSTEPEDEDEDTSQIDRKQLEEDEGLYECETCGALLDLNETAEGEYLCPRCSSVVEYTPGEPPRFITPDGGPPISLTLNCKQESTRSLTALIRTYASEHGLDESTIDRLQNAVRTSTELIRTEAYGNNENCTYRVLIVTESSGLRLQFSDHGNEFAENADELKALSDQLNEVDVEKNPEGGNLITLDVNS